MKKICSVCKIKKDYEEFVQDKRTSTGRYSACRKCCYKKYRSNNPEGLKAYYSTFEGRISLLYYLVRIRTKKFISKGRTGFKPITYTRKEFSMYLLKNTKYKEVFENWKNKGMKFRDVPTIDRIDNSKDYQLKNIQCLSFIENRLKQNNDCGYITKLSPNELLK